MSKWSILMTVVMVLALLLACGPAAPEPTMTPATPAEKTPLPELTSAPTQAPGVPPEKAHLTPNPVEESMPIYGGILITGNNIPRTFDGHEKVGFGPVSTLPTFNQLVIFDSAYKDLVSENIIGDLAESWETSPDGTEITFKLHQGVKWHDGMPFTADDVVYSMDKMTDDNRSKITFMFPAYDSAEKIDDNTVKIHLKYPSASFMLALASCYSQIQPKHLAGTDPQSADFMIGTGPWILTDHIVRVSLAWKRNPDYFKKDQYGNQLPYLDEIHLRQFATELDACAAFVARRLDLKGLVMGPQTVNEYQTVLDGAPEALWQPMSKEDGAAIQLNMSQKPLDDVRVRRAMGLVLDQESLVIGFSGDPMFGKKDIGFLSSGLPKEEVLKLMGWDKPYSERVAEAQKLMAEAGYPDGFKMRFLSAGIAGASTGYAGANLVFADIIHRYLKIDATAQQLPEAASKVEMDEGNYEATIGTLTVGYDPSQLKGYFGVGQYNNRSHYSNPELEKMLDELDRIIDPDKRREVIWEIERTLLTDLPALPTGIFTTRMMCYYPHVKNPRWTNTNYSNICRVEDVWIDPSLKPADFGTR